MYFLKNKGHLKRTGAVLLDQAEANITSLSIKEYSHICIDERHTYHDQILDIYLTLFPYIILVTV